MNARLVTVTVTVMINGHVPHSIFGLYCNHIIKYTYNGQKAVTYFMQAEQSPLVRGIEMYFYYGIHIGNDDVAVVLYCILLILLLRLV